ncbi:hypothetical protein FE257_007101 [Aspergillus nanangensis]|uniref:GPI anchored protein n=1 Tax=Aspergillus nanangensis TaxID=2582783 RepID=A0AAD4CPU2_ASPNN|nr:hypothetical protein FE257_007101 [Aspergillus nanangensis]
MHSKLLTTMAMVGLACAQQKSVTSMFIFGADPQPLVASIVGNDATATTYSINCPSGTLSDECGMGPGLTLIAGPKATTYKWDADTFHLTATCSVASTVECDVSQQGGNSPGHGTSMIESPQLLPVTVTAGSVTSAGNSPSATTTGSAASAQSGEPTATGSTKSASGTASESTGGLPQVTANAGGILGGAVVAFVAALL